MSKVIVVNVRPALNLVFNIIRWFSISFLLPIGVALFYRENVMLFVVPAILALVLSMLGERLTRSQAHVGVREGFLVVAITWLAISAFGAIPYLIDHHTLMDAFFESMSGFTTTGATVLTGLEHKAKSLLIWRQFSQWLGGMGIIVLAIAVLPKLSVGGRQMMESEAPGPQLEKLTPHLYQTARALWIIYVGLTLSEILMLKLAGMSFFDSVAHAFSTMATGGFSPYSDSFESFGPAVQWIVIVYMVVAGISFALMFRVLTGRFKQMGGNSEFRFYLGLLLFSGLLLALLLNQGTFEEQLRHGMFQAVSITTGTGFASADFDRWPILLQQILLMLMFFGGCAGSTTGSIKIVRALLSFKYVLREIRKVIHPSAVIPIRLGQRVVSEDALSGVVGFAILYMTTFALGSVSMLFIAYVEKFPISIFEGVSVVASALGNVGPAFGMAGPMNNYTDFPDSAKAFMVLLMWIGRLELFPVFVLFTRRYWMR